eukprot:TRINITY_DN686_c0_g1_i1.p1 TRINITY_DN686_c0_g1~~TRINITY_DN686_c0_g1_i1.p1  ORF type:complete len:1973 (+),score=886.41 TRINITY_DN686_c0_g1_i1:52-5970(+)
MSRPGTAQDIESLQASTERLKEELKETPPAAAKALDWFKQRVYEDAVCAQLRKYWALFDTAKEGDGEFVSAEEYRGFIRMVLRLSGESDTACQVACNRVVDADTAGFGRLPFPNFVSRVTAAAALLYPDPEADVHGRLAKLFDALTEENPNPPPGEEAGLAYKSLADVEADAEGAAVATQTAYYTDDGWSTLRCTGALLPMLQDLSLEVAPPRFVVLGDPCTGKSALAAELSGRFNLLNLDVPELVCKEMEKGGDLGAKLQGLVNSCQPVPVELQAEVVGQWVEHPAVAARGFVLSDFPLLPPTAAGDAYLEQWVETTGLARAGVHVVHIECTDSLSVADEWTRQFGAARARYAAADDAEATLRGQEAAAATAAAAPAAGDGDETPPEDDEEAAAAKEAAAAAAVAAEKRRLMYDVSKAVHKGRLLCFNRAARDVPPGEDAPDAEEDDLLAEYEGDSPFLPIASHAALGELVSSATCRGTYDTLPHHDPPARQVDVLAHYYPHIAPTDAAEPHDFKAPDDGADMEALEAEVLEKVKAPLSAAWGKHCPVVYKELGVAVEGLVHLPVVYKGKLYYLTSQARRAAFVEAPEVYLEAAPRLRGTPLLLVGKEKDLLSTLGTSDADLAALILKDLGYTTLSVSEYCATWKAAKEDEAARIEDYVTRKAALEKQLSEEESSLEKLLKKRKAKEDKEKKKKKKGEEEAPKEEAPPEEAPEEAEKRPLTAEEKKAEEVAAAVAKAANELSIVVNALEVSSLEELEYLQKMGLLPAAVVAVDAAPPAKEEDGEEAAEPEGDADGEGEDAAPKEPEPDPEDMTHPKVYAKKVGAFLEKLATPAEDGAGGDGGDGEGGDAAAGAAAPSVLIPTVDYKVAPVNAFNQTVFEFLRALQYQLDPHAPKAKETEPQEEAGGDGDGDGDGDDAAKGDKPDPRLTPGPTALSQHGASGKYCPVVLKDKRMLVMGEPETAVLYNEKRYIFRSAAEKELFLRQPYAYVSEGDGVKAPPPPALWVVGSSRSRTEDFCEALQEDYGIPTLAFPEVFDLAAAAARAGPKCPHAKAAAEEVDAAETFERKQRERQAEKDAHEKAKEEGEDVEENAELDEWEPEEAEAKEERVFQCRLRILRSLLKAEPYVSKGHVLTAVPTKEEHLDALKAADVIPEALVHCNLDREAYLRWALPEEMEKRKAAFEEKTQALKERAAERAAKTQERELRKWRRRNIGADDEDDEGDEEEDEEVPPVDQDEVGGELGTAYDEEIAGKETVLTKAGEARVPIVHVNAAATPTVMLSTGMLQLNRFLAHRPSLLAAPYLTTHAEAARRLRIGELAVSPFGRADPVAQHHLLAGAHRPVVLKKEKKVRPVDADDDAPPPPPKEPKDGDGEDEEEAAPEEPEEEPEAELEGEELDELKAKVAAQDEAKRAASLPRPVVYGRQLYWLSNDENTTAFLDHPERFTRQRPLLPNTLSADPLVCLRGDSPVPARGLPYLILLPGRLPDGARSLGHHMAANLKAVHVTMPKLLEAVVRSDTELADAVKKCVLEGEGLGSRLLARCILHRLSLSDVKIRGCVLDGVCGEDFALVEALDAALSGEYSIQNVILTPEAAPKCTRVMYHFQTHYGNVTKLSENMTPLQRLRTALAAVHAAAQKRTTLTSMRLVGRPAETSQTAQPDVSVRERMSKFGTYCVSNWADKKLLVDCAGSHGAGLAEASAVEYGGKLFFFADKDGVARFLEAPAKYEDSDNMYPLPAHLPMLLDLRTAEKVLHTTTTDWAKPQPTHWQFRGFCPVTLYQTRDNVGLKGEKNPSCLFGANNCAVLYLEKNYRMRDADCLKLFMQQPWLYIDGAQLPPRLPIPKSILPQLDTVSMENFLREALYEGVVRAMLAAGEVRPGLPGSSVQASAIRYVAAHLKAHNPYNTPLKSQVYKKNLSDYEEVCALSQFFSSKERLRASEEEVARKAKLWSDVKSKTLDPSHFEQFNLDEGDAA